MLGDFTLVAEMLSAMCIMNDNKVLISLVLLTKSTFKNFRNLVQYIYIYVKLKANQLINYYALLVLSIRVHAKLY